MRCLKENLPEGNLGNLMLLPPVRLKRAVWAHVGLERLMGPFAGLEEIVDLGKARAGGSSTNAFAFWDLLDPPMCARVVPAGFGGYAAGLRCTQPRFPPAMRYALMEQWNDCTHTFIFDFGELNLTPADNTAITGLGFDGLVAPLDARYQTATLGAQLVRTLLGVATQTRYTAQGCVSYEVIYHFWAERIRTRLAAWREGSGGLVWAYEYRIYPGGPSGDTPADSRRIPRYLAHCHHTFSSFEDPHYWRAEAEAEAEAAAPAGPAGAVLGDVPFPPGMEVALDPALGLRSAIIIPADLRQAPPPLQLDPEHATHVPTQRYQELCRRFGFARSYIARLYSERHERDLGIGRLRRHQSRQSSAVTRLQLEVDRLRMRLEVEGIPLDFFEDEEDDDGSSSNDAPPSPPPQAAAGPSRRRR
ncbi:hypothetical protein JCGZ_14988 [Jatropha curcas]|uniref:Aminotransferase-like plant mobile domain-containing protein n=1 Tax=Jatropha curcas TaxID=180498 RepID=A0A067K7U7_JATCU|nr:hypothetical protein JCGZ_14988 [Jatropha curcas]